MSQKDRQKTDSLAQIRATSIGHGDQILKMMTILLYTTKHMQVAQCIQSMWSRELEQNCFGVSKYEIIYYMSLQCLIIISPITVQCRGIIFVHDTVQQKTCKGENIRKFWGFRAIHESFLHEIWVCSTHNDRFQHFVKWSLLTIRESFLPQQFPTIRQCINQFSI